LVDSQRYYEIEEQVVMKYRCLPLNFKSFSGQFENEIKLWRPEQRTSATRRAATFTRMRPTFQKYTQSVVIGRQKAFEERGIHFGGASE